MSRADTTDDRQSTPATAPIQAVLRVEPSPEAACPVLESGPQRGTVTQDVVDGDARLCRATVGDDHDRLFLEATVGDGCVCPVFRRHNCVASVDSVEDGALFVSLSTTDRDELAAIVTSLRAHGATVTLERATSGDVDTDRPSFELVVDDLTAIQRETLRVAVESGYYERPRRTDLGALADRFGVSRSAVSQRLSAVESKLVHELVDAMDAADTDDERTTL